MKTTFEVTHGWVDEVAHTEDIRLRSHRITLTYNKLGRQWEEVNFFDFATWGTHTVGRVIRAELPQAFVSMVAPVQDKVAKHLAEAQLTMFADVAHDGVDRKRNGWPLTDTLETAFEEQRRVCQGVTDAFNALADYWHVDRDEAAKFVTRSMLGTELPGGEVLRPSERVPGTHGPVGAPVDDYRQLEQRLLWVEGVLETHIDKVEQMKTPVYTPEQEQAIVLGGEVTWN